MSARKMDAQRRLIEQQRDRLLGEIEAIRNKIAGLELALSLLGSEEKPLEAAPAEKVRGGLKGTLMDLLREAGTTGLNANTAVEIAQRRGIHMDRQSVSSTLSRFKRDNIVEYHGDRYKLVQFANVSEGGMIGGDIVPFRSAN